VPGQQFPKFTKGSLVVEPVHKLALKALGWGALTALSFFFHFIAFGVVFCCLVMALSKFKFVYENTRIPDDADLTEYPVTVIRHEPE
jgi:hypothetical protein